MSARHTTSMLAIAALIASAAAGSAQNAIAPHDMANIPMTTETFRARPAAPFGAPAITIERNDGSLSLFENAWDFTNPDSIPGFGSLPPNYDSRPVMPQISGK